jgi:formamidopyrimidine-DNA glycosylase
MPELPEVETVARGLAAVLVGRTVTGVDVRWARTLLPPEPGSFARRLTGQSVTTVGRRGKWIVIELSGGDTLLIHLRMTGRLEVGSGESSDDAHLRVLFSLDDGNQVRFNDPRKFGRIALTADPQERLGELGPEPLGDEFTAARLGEMLARRRGRIKPLLLNQRFLVGLGNIYADESLWRAGVHPQRRAGGLAPAEVHHLHWAIREVLQAAIDSGGTTLADTAYRQPDGQSGAFADLLSVYGREGQPCPRCRTDIERIVVTQRGTHLCPQCQPVAEPNFKVENVDNG